MFPNTLKTPSTDCFWKPICSVTRKMLILWKYLQNLTWWISFFLKVKRNLWKIIAAYSVSKNAALSQSFFCHILRAVPKEFWSFSKFFQSTAIGHSLPLKLICAFNRYTKLKMLIFDPIACGKTADTCND